MEKFDDNPKPLIDGNAMQWPNEEKNIDIQKYTEKLRLSNMNHNKNGV